MATKTSVKAPKGETEKEAVLPLPRAVLDHHGPGLTKLLSGWKDLERVPPVLLITGPTGVGKREVSYFLAQALLCERAGFAKASDGGQSLFGDEGPGLFGETASDAPTASSSALACGDCSACHKALHGTWVDFTEIAAEGDEDDGGATGTLKIDQFRKLKATQGFGAFDGGYRITLIRDADRMTVQAANSLLKLLEEPPPGWVFFLTASDPTLLLPTLVSRCQKIRLLPFTRTALESLLTEEGVSADRVSICAGLAQGSWRKALRLASADAWENRLNLFRFLEEPQRELNALLDWAARDTPRFELLIDQLEQLVADLLEWAAAAAPPPQSWAWRNADGKRALAAHAQTVLKRHRDAAGAREFWRKRAERLFKARHEMWAPLNRKLLIQDVLIPWIDPAGEAR